MAKKEEQENIKEFEEYLLPELAVISSEIGKDQLEQEKGVTVLDKDLLIGGGGEIVSDASYSETGFRVIGNLAIGTNKVSIITTDVTVANTTTETNLISVSIPAKTLGKNRGVRARLDISAINTAGGGTLTIRFKYGATTLVTSGDVALGSAGAGWIDVALLSTGEAAQDGSMNVFFSTEGTNSAALTQSFSNGQGTAAINSELNQNLVVSAAFSVAAATNTITMVNTVVEKIV